MDFAVALEEQGVFRDGLFNQLLEHEHLRAVDDGVDAVLEGLHRGEGLKGIAQQDDGGVAAQAIGMVCSAFKVEFSSRLFAPNNSSTTTT